MATPISGPEDHGPGVRVPPPVIVAGLCALGWGLKQVAPLPIGPPAPGLALVLLLAGGALALWAVAVMLLAKTDPLPHRPDQALVERGPFRVSRNPIYLGFVLAAAGLALLWGDLWPWLATAGCFLALDRYVIAREERYLRVRFGTAYEGYAGRVRRWM